MSIPNINSLVQDVVGVFTSDFRQVFKDARPIKATIKEANKVMEHPLETGASTADHVITLLVNIELSLIFKPGVFKSAYDEVKQLSKNRTTLTVQTRTDVYKNMIIENMPHTEDAEMMDTISMALTLTEFQLVTAQYGPALPANRNTQARGNVQTTEATEKQGGSVLGQGGRYLQGKSK